MSLPRIFFFLDTSETSQPWYKCRWCAGFLSSGAPASSREMKATCGGHTGWMGSGLAAFGRLVPWVLGLTVDLCLHPGDAAPTCVRSFQQGPFLFKLCAYDSV